MLIKTLMKMIFDVLKKLFGWCDEIKVTNSRKRHAGEFDDYDYVNIKKMRREQNNMNNNRDIIEIEDESDDVQICEDEVFESSHNNSSHNSNNLLRKRNSLCYNNQKKPTNHLSSKKNCFTMNSFTCKSRLNSKCTVPRYTALSKTHQLREKEQYGQMLQNFLPRIQVIPSTPDTRRHQLQKPIELIDIENCEPSTSSKLDVFSTPQLKSPSRWFTPMSRPLTTSTLLQGRSVEVIKLDESDESFPSTPTLSQKSKSSEQQIKKLHINRESIATNSLRDRLSGTAVMKGDFIPRVAERYNERMEKRSKEAEELERMRTILSKHNRLQREAALEEQLARSMRLYEAVLEEPEDEEDEALPELTSEMVGEVHRALIPRPHDQVLAEGFGLRITRKDINTLSGLNWLNDEVINFYMNLLIQRGKEEKYPSVYAMNTFFYPKLLSGGHSVLKRWTRKVDIFAQDIVVVPVHLQMHWCMSIIDFRDKSIRYYDSMGGENLRCLQALKKYLEEESLDKKKVEYDTSDWTLESMRDIPQQENGSDCGVFSCTFAEFICAERKITFSQDDMPYFRSKMVYEILKSKLL